jgi:hypothetical protein
MMYMPDPMMGPMSAPGSIAGGMTTLNRMYGQHQPSRGHMFGRLQVCLNT